MAKKQIHNSTQLPLMTDEGKSVNVFDGPWDTIEAFETWWNETTDGEALEAGVVIGVRNDTNVDRYCWLIPTGSSGYWKKLDYLGSIIEFAGVVSDVNVTLSVYNIAGNRATVFYDETTGTFIIRAANLKYYSDWKNFHEFGELDEDERVYPYEGKIYVNITTGQLFYATSNELSPVEGGGISLDDDQQAAVDSGITAELVDELKRLKAMNIRYVRSKDELTITDASVEDVTEGTQTYDLSEGGGSTSYGEPTVTLSYAESVGNTASTLDPSILVVQRKVKGDSETTLSYDSVSGLVDAGATVTFSLVQSASGVSINSQTGVLTFSNNTTGGIKVVQVAVAVTNVNEVGLDGSATSNEIRQGKVYIKSVSYGEPVSDGNGGYTISPIYTASNNETYTYAEYVAADISKETFSFSVSSSSDLYGAVLNSTTGAITYNISTMLSGLSGGDIITTTNLKCNQSNVDALSVRVPALFDYADESEYVAFNEWINNVGGDTTDDNPTTVAYRSRCSAALSIPAIEDEVFFFKIYIDETANYATHAWLLETATAAFVTGDAAYASGSKYPVSNVKSIEHTDQAYGYIIYKVKASATQYLTICGFRKALGYYKIQ